MTDRMILDGLAIRFGDRTEVLTILGNGSLSQERGYRHSNALEDRCRRRVGRISIIDRQEDNLVISTYRAKYRWEPILPRWDLHMSRRVRSQRFTGAGILMLGAEILRGDHRLSVYRRQSRNARATTCQAYAKTQRQSKRLVSPSHGAKSTPPLENPPRSETSGFD